jgi:hypothetical protein
MKKLFERSELGPLLNKATPTDRAEVVMLNRYHRILESMLIV